VRRPPIPLLLTAVLFGATGLAYAQEVSVRSRTTGATVRASADKIVVRPRAGLSPMERARLHSDYRARVLEHLPLTDLDVVAVPAGETVDSLLDEYAADGRVDLAEANILFTPERVPDDPLYAVQRHLTQIRCPAAWDVTTGSDSVVVAIIDTGVDLDHPDLEGAIWHNPNDPVNGIDDDGDGLVDDWCGWDYVDGDNTPEPSPDGIDNNGADGIDENVTHGTQVAGCVAAIGNNGVGVSGVSWSTKLMVLKVFPDDGAGDLGKIAEAMMYAIAHGADIINLSLGGGYNRVMDSAIDEAFSRGVLVVAAAGNGGTNLDNEPASPVSNDRGSNKVLGVAAVTDTDRKAAFSSYGRRAVDVCAPGVGVLTTTFYDGTIEFPHLYETGSGTSFSTPIVSGIAALVMSVRPDLSGAALRNRLIAATDPVDSLNPGYEGMLGSGRVDAELAVSDALERRPSVPNEPQPAVGASGLGSSATLSWRASTDPFGEPVAYDVYFGDQEPPPLRYTTSDASVDVSGLVTGHAYRWRVVARNASGWQAQGPVWGFVAGSEDGFEPDDTPEQAAAAEPDGRLVRRVLTAGDSDYVALDATAGVTYELRTYVSVPGGAAVEATAKDTGASVRASTGTDTVLTLYDSDLVLIAENDDTQYGQDLASRLLWTCQGAGRYYVRVRGYSGDTTGPYDLVIGTWSDGTAEPPTLPSDPQPADLAVNVDPAATISWHGGTAAGGQQVRYDVVMSSPDDPVFNTATDLSEQRFAPVGLRDGVTYGWRVRARDSSGAVTAGPEWRFTVGLGDPYEPDDLPQTAGAILPGGAEQVHAFVGAGDVDHVRFSAQAGEEYTVITGRASGLPYSAAKLDLLGPDGTVVATGVQTVGYTPAQAGAFVVRLTPVAGEGFYRLQVTGPRPEAAAITVSVEPADLRYGERLLASGSVTDALGVPIPGVSVDLELGGSAGTLADSVASDARGAFSVEIDSARFPLGLSRLTARVHAAHGIAAESAFTTSLSHEFPVAVGGRALRIVSSPVGGTPEDLFGVGPSAEGHSLAAYSPSEGAYIVHYGLQVAIEPGIGYFIKQVGAMTLRATAGSMPDPTRPYVIPLEAGWNLVGNPYAAPLVWNIDAIKVRRAGTTVGTLREAAQAGLVDPYVWAWDPDGDAYTLVFDALVTGGQKGVLDPYEGAFIKVGEPDLAFEIPAPAASTARSASTGARRGRAGWLRLEVTSADGRADALYADLAGEAPGSGAAPPVAPGREGDAAAVFLVSGVRAAIASVSRWAPAIIELKAGHTAGPVTVAAPDMRALPRDIRPVLVDTASGRAADLRSGAQLTVGLAAGETRLVRLELADAASKLTIRIDDASGTTRGEHVTAVTSRPADISALVLNAAGRVVRSIPLGERPGGQVEILWDGRCDTGSSVPAGSYVVLIRAESADGQRATARVEVSR